MYVRVHPYVLFLLRIVQGVFTLATLIPVAINVYGMQIYENYESLILVEPFQVYLFVTCGVTLVYLLPMALYELLRTPGMLANTFRFISDAFIAAIWAALLGIAIWCAVDAEEYDYMTQDYLVYAIPALTGITFVLFLISMLLVSSQRRDAKNRARLFPKEYPESMELNNVLPEPVTCRTCNCHNASYAPPRLAVPTAPRQDTKGHFELHSPLERVELESPSSDYATVMSPPSSEYGTVRSPPPTYHSNSHFMVGSKEALAGPSRRSFA